MPEPEKKPPLISGMIRLLRDDSIPLMARILFCLAFSFGLLWSVSIALTNLFAP